LGAVGRAFWVQYTLRIEVFIEQTEKKNGERDQASCYGAWFPCKTDVGMKILKQYTRNSILTFLEPNSHLVDVKW